MLHDTLGDRKLLGLRVSIIVVVAIVTYISSFSSTYRPPHTTHLTNTRHQGLKIVIFVEQS
jgi:hypothetical protein